MDGLAVQKLLDPAGVDAGALLALWEQMLHQALAADLA